MLSFRFCRNLTASICSHTFARLVDFQHGKLVVVSRLNLVDQTDWDEANALESGLFHILSREGCGRFRFKAFWMAETGSSKDKRNRSFLGVLGLYLAQIR